jgi:predicted RNA-binding Zn-ribbon protein involved in translation (DUF1610 family)
MELENREIQETENCVGCGAEYEVRKAALSRYDNKTHVCSTCGLLEASIQLDALRIGLDPHAVLSAPGKRTGMGLA